MKLLLIASLVVGSNGFSLNTNGFSRQAVRSGSFSRQQSVAPHRVAMRRTVVMANAAKEGSVVVAPDYKLAAIFLAGGVLLDTIPYIQFLGAIVTLLGILFAVQTTRIRFVFDDDAFELKMGDELEESGDNIVVGGANRWTYDSFVNYDFFPEGWIDQPQGPILVYFKETQTPKDQWNVGPGAPANSDEALAKGAVPGQVHFFPALCDTKQLRTEFQRRQCAKL